MRTREPVSGLDRQNYLTPNKAYLILNLSLGIFDNDRAGRRDFHGMAFQQLVLQCLQSHSADHPLNIL